MRQKVLKKFVIFLHNRVISQTLVITSNKVFNARQEKKKQEWFIRQKTRYLVYNHFAKFVQNFTISIEIYCSPSIHKKNEKYPRRVPENRFLHGERSRGRI